MRVLFFLLLPFVAGGQNLLVNGNFEDENICSEYKVNCAPEAWLYTVPSFNYYLKDDALAHGGVHYISLVAGHSIKPYYRTYVRSRLLCALRPGKTYRLELFVKSTMPIQDSAGVYFSAHDFLFERRPAKEIRPSFYLSEAKRKPVRSDTGWQKISLDYKATGGEQFVSLGFFKKSDLKGAPGSRFETKYYIYFDDLSLTPLDPKEKLCNDWRNTSQRIMSEDERHEYLERNLLQYKAKGPPPVSTTSTKLVKIDTLIVPDILFATNSAQLDKQALLLLDSFMRQRPAENLDSIVVEGHTDNVGSDAWNKQLSVNRAQSVAYYLEYFMNARIMYRGFGSSRPVADNRQTGGRRKNRRVEIYLYFKD